MKYHKGTEGYGKCIMDHECPINHKGSAGAMEASDVLRIYEKSVKHLKLRYMIYIGDGDSNAYPSVVKSPLRGVCWTCPKTGWGAFTQI